MRAEAPVQHLLELKLHDRLAALDQSMAGVLGVATIDLTSGRIYVYNGDAVFPTASTIKIPILTAMFRAHIDLDRKVTLTAAESVGGSGKIQDQLKAGPVTLTVRELMTAMIRDSDNTATNACIRLVGLEAVNRMLGAQGFHATRLRRVMMDAAAAARGDENTTSPLEMARFVEMLHRDRLTPEADTRQIVDMLKLVRADIRAVVSPSVEVASKPGDLTGVHCETAIVYLPGRPFIVSVYSTFLDDEVNPVPAVAKLVFEYFRKLAESNLYGNRVK